MISVAVAGACGRMGRSMITVLSQNKDMELICAVESSSNPTLGKDAGEVSGLGNIGISIESSEGLKELLGKYKPNVLVDFTNSDAAVENSKVAANAGVNLVIGTTGFDDSQRKEIEKAVEHNGISAVISPNMATGVNVFFKLARDTAKILEGYEVEIIEAHHKHKKDSPSGTALRVGELVAEETGKSLEDRAVYGRQGTGERNKDEIGFHSIRAGGIVGEHTVLFAGEGERIEITHRAQSREAFAQGALRAVRFIHGKKDGLVYTTWDVLGID